MDEKLLEEIIQKYPAFKCLLDDNGALGIAQNSYEKIIGIQRDYEIDVKRDLQRVINRCRERSLITNELSHLDKHYAPQIVSRVKSLDSVYPKIAKKEITWKDLPLDDTIGYRLICRFLDEALELRTILDDELNKPPFTITSRFPRTNSGEWSEKEINSGYRSYDFAFVYKRQELGIELEGELQVRTVLQHAWAEVSHDTFYKNESLAAASEDYLQNLVKQMHALSDMLFAVDTCFVQLRKLTGLAKLFI
ncbi:MAG: RelA/SpoT domain-containing protein [archaeon]|nr:RelA/SpoT domain-containing protein [archaeon]